MLTAHECVGLRPVLHNRLVSERVLVPLLHGEPGGCSCAEAHVLQPFADLRACHTNMQNISHVVLALPSLGTAASLLGCAVHIGGVFKKAMSGSIAVT